MALDYLGVLLIYPGKRTRRKEEVSGGCERGFWVVVRALAIEAQESWLGGQD